MVDGMNERREGWCKWITSRAAGWLKLQLIERTAEKQINEKLSEWLAGLLAGRMGGRIND